MLDESADAQCADRRRAAGLLIGQTVGGGEERGVLVLEVLKQRLTLSGYGKRHWNHASSLREVRRAGGSNGLTRRWHRIAEEHFTGTLVSSINAADAYR